MINIKGIEKNYIDNSKTEGAIKARIKKDQSKDAFFKPADEKA